MQQETEAERLDGHVGAWVLNKDLQVEESDTTMSKQLQMLRSYISLFKKSSHYVTVDIHDNSGALFISGIVVFAT